MSIMVQSGRRQSEQKIYDFRTRTVRIDQSNSPMLPKIGDILVGYVEMLFGSMLSIRILFINDKKSYSGFLCDYICPN